MIKSILNNIFKYKEPNNYEFVIPNSSNNINDNNFKKIDNQTVSSNLDINLEYLKVKYNMLINKDIKTRDFILTIQGKKFPAFLLYIDGLVDNNSINNFVLEPLLLRNSIKMKDTSSASSNPLQKNKTIKFNLEKFIYSSLIPQNSISKETNFKNIISKVNTRILCPFY